MGVHGLHDWWHCRLELAGTSPKGQRSGERMHKARHTAGSACWTGQTENWMPLQKLLGHASISTTGGVYTDWDIDLLADTLRGILDAEADS